MTPLLTCRTAVFPTRVGMDRQRLSKFLRPHVFPTRVGMDRTPTVTGAANTGIPHTRGDGPTMPKSAKAYRKYSPHAWGWTGMVCATCARWSVFPTRVGMDRWIREWSNRLGRIPHTRGDGPHEHTMCAFFSTYSPHAWGWTEHALGALHAHRVFPTRVGMDRMYLRALSVTYRIPHTRGDGPNMRIAGLSIFAYSPHAWGWTESNRASKSRRFVFPTRVGMDRQSVTSSTASMSIPHTRGDGPSVSPHPENASTYSPHAWGWTDAGLNGSAHFDVFPTRVGMDRSSSPMCALVWRIPHTRGDGPRSRAPLP